ncbi:PAAR-like protein [Chryseobacterium tructae]|uniref:PAAR-like protein n=1 Tax=Chryseobacterium tructae TaxID=1037380 RepID=A0ABV7Y256_9FLAO|nr:PAAR-like protein [Chryseobacterium tructae]MDN3694158.1 PAAR-like protein [Chryseobacterium tructae]
MKNYVIQQGDTFSSLAQQFKLKNEGILKTYHNLHCSEEDIMQEPVPGKKIIIPDDPQLMAEEASSPSTPMDSSQEETTNEGTAEDSPSDQSASENQSSEKSEEKQEKEKKENKDGGGSSGPHEGKYFVIQKGTVQCNQGFKFPKFKVTSHQKHYWNDKEGQADYLAATEDDLQFDPPAQPFGQCKLKPTSGGYLPCAYAAAGKWQKPYEKVKVMGKSCLTEISELMCATGGKITILKHGQQSEAGKNQVNKADTKEQQVYNPVVNFDQFKAETDEQEAEAW